MEELIRQVKEAMEFWVEEMESIRAYDTAKAFGGEVILFEQAVIEIERKHRDTCRECSNPIGAKT